MRLWERVFIESRLTSPHAPTRIDACRTAYCYGFDIDEIAELTEFPVWRVRQVVLGAAVNRTTDD